MYVYGNMIHLKDLGLFRVPRILLEVDPLPPPPTNMTANGTFMGLPLNWVETHRVLSVLIAFGCASIAVLISAFNIYGHLVHYGRPQLQRYIVRILVIVPMYAVGSWLSLQFVQQAIYVDTIRDCYEAFVVYSFLALVLAFAGGEGACASKLQGEQDLPHPFPFSYCLPPMARDGRLVRGCKRGTLQFVFVKPTFAFISLIMLAIGKYDRWEYQMLLLFIYNVSYSLALYCLLIFYLSTKEILSAFRPVTKFLAVKSVIFLTFWQSLMIGMVPNITPAQAFAWKDLILCLEMVLFSILHMIAFSSKEFQSNFEKMPETEVLENIKEVLSVTDIVADAYHNFMPAYQDYMLQRGEDEFAEKYRARTFFVGNLDNPIAQDEENSSSLPVPDSALDCDSEEEIEIRLSPNPLDSSSAADSSPDVQRQSLETSLSVKNRVHDSTDSIDFEETEIQESIDISPNSVNRRKT